MKAIYIALIVVAVIVVAMLALSFFYLDQHRRQTFLYALYYDDVLAGYEKVDRYVLENSVIYKSVTESPRDILHRKTIRKVSFDSRGKNFIDYRKEVLSNGAKSLFYISDIHGDISFMAAGHAIFSFLKGIIITGNELPFESMSIASYPALIRRYNFKKRGEQFANALRPIAAFMPPVHDIVSITSMGRDTIQIEGRNVNCERLILELKSGDLASVWITRTFHNILMVNIPKYGFKAVLSSEKKPIPVEEYVRKKGAYTEQEVTFTNDDISFSGTLSVPSEGEGPYPAVLLIWGPGPLDRSARGLFTDIAHSLAEAGYCSLRFDKRGIGQSQGFFSTYAQPEELSDLKHAIAFIKSQPVADKTRIALLGHSEGGFYAAELTALDNDIRACVIMSAVSSLSPISNNYEKLRAFIGTAAPGNKEYFESAVTAIEGNREMVKGKGDWITIMGKRVFTKKIRLEDNYDPVETIKRVKVPVLILHGRKDDINPIDGARRLGDALAKSGNNDFTTVYFNKLGHFFGITARSAPIRDHIEISAEVLDKITSWLDENLISPPPLEPPLIEKRLEAGPSQEISQDAAPVHSKGQDKSMQGE